MLERMDLPPELDGVEAVGRVTKEDYENILIPLLEERQKADRACRFLYWVGPRFEAFSPGAAFEDMKAGFRFFNLFERCAIVTDIGWVETSCRVVGSLMPCPVRLFKNQDLHTAVEWLASLEGFTGNLKIDLNSDRKVFIVEPTGALSRQDFQKARELIDPWIDEHGELNGIVIHAQRFPGWENFGSFIRHLQFVKAHHKKVRRVALSTDSAFLEMLPAVARHFVEAELKTFSFNELEQAVDWASNS